MQLANTAIYIVKDAGFFGSNREIWITTNNI